MTPGTSVGDATAVAAVSAAIGAGATAASRAWLGTRRTDKVDAVAAVAAAFDTVAARTAAHVDDLSAQCKAMQARMAELERELRKRDELILRYIAGATAPQTAGPAGVPGP